MGSPDFSYIRKDPCRGTTVGNNISVNHFRKDAFTGESGPVTDNSGPVYPNPYSHPPEKPWPGASSSGFTLLEILAVMAIFAGILALVLPRFMDFRVTYLRTDAGRVATLVRYLSESSDTRRLYYRLTFDLDSKTLTVARSVDGKKFISEPEPALKGIRLRGGVKFVDIMVSGVGKVTSGEVAIFFSPAVSKEAFILHMGSGDDVKTLSFNPYSGRVKVEDGYI